MSTPNGIRLESAWTPVASIDVRHPTPREATFWFVKTIHVPHGRGQAKADGSLRSLRGGVLS